jgi:arginase
MKTIRLLYPDYLGGGLDTYWFGARLLQHILPANPAQPLVTVGVPAPDGKQKPVVDGICARDEVLAGIADAKRRIAEERPDRIITIGGNCLVSLAPFDYLHGRYPDAGIVWIDAHPDVSTPQDGYPFAHAMVLGSLLGAGDPGLAGMMEHPPFMADQVLYVGLQGLHGYQERFLKEAGVSYRIQTDAFLSTEEIRAFAGRFSQVMVHFDIDVLDERHFHSTYFANPEHAGDGSGGGRMDMATLAEALACIAGSAEVAGFTIAEYLPFDEHRLHKLLCGLRLFTE